jgi:hypothetical protein
MLAFKVDSIEEKNIKLEEKFRISHNVVEKIEYEQKITNVIITPIEQIVDPNNIESIIEIKEVVESDKPITPTEAFLRSGKQQELLRSTLIAHNNYYDEVQNIRLNTPRRSKSYDVSKKLAKDREKISKPSINNIKDAILRHGIDIDLGKKRDETISNTNTQVLCASCSKKLVKDTITTKKPKPNKTGCFSLKKISK